MSKEYQLAVVELEAAALQEELRDRLEGAALEAINARMILDLRLCAILESKDGH